MTNDFMNTKFQNANQAVKYMLKIEFVWQKKSICCK